MQKHTTHIRTVAHDHLYTVALFDTHKTFLDFIQLLSLPSPLKTKPYIRHSKDGEFN